MKRRLVRVAIGMLAVVIMMGCKTGELVNESESEIVLNENTETERIEIENSESSIDYIKLLGFEKTGYLLNTVDNDNVNNFGERSHVTYETRFGNTIKSGTIWVEEWYDGTCMKSLPGVISPETEEIYIVMDVAMTGTSRVMIATDAYDGTWEVYYDFPFEAETVVDRHFSALEDGKVTELVSGEECILSMVAFDMGMGANGYDCNSLIEEHQKIEEMEYGIVVRAVFEDEPYESKEKSSDGSYPTNLFRLDEVIRVEDEARKNAYILGLENVLYKWASPIAGENEDWTVGVNSYAILDVNFDGKEELVLQHESVMADTSLYIYGYNEKNETIELLFCDYPALTFYDNGVIIAEASHNQSGNEFWPYTLWMLNKDTGTYEAVVYVDSAKRDAEVREQYIGNAKVMEIPLEVLPRTIANAVG